MSAQATSRLFGMDDQVWLRHANPLSGWSRYTVLPLFFAAVWSRAWIGWWALLPIAAVALWTWLNPRLFPKPASTDHWMSKAVLGERVWANREAVPVPDHHLPVLRATRIISFIGILFGFYGLATLEVWPTIFGMTVLYLGKTWFLDRMVWLYDEMKDKVPEYGEWLYPID